jgi:hypothetical protein
MKNTKSTEQKRKIPNLLKEISKSENPRVGGSNPSQATITLKKRTSVRCPFSVCAIFVQQNVFNRYSLSVRIVTRLK